MYMKKKDWDIDLILSQIQTISLQCRSPYNDGYTAFELKKELHTLKEAINDALESTPTFAGEKEWLTEREHLRIIKLLKK